jgi:hypothetical protein
MGYETSYRLTVSNDYILSDVFDDSTENEELQYALEQDGSTRESCKWYNHEADMRRISLLHKGVLFTLHGKGEESGDIWAKYFLNGKMQVEKAKIVIASFDSDKLA